jgi:hypothetical protein
MGICAVCGAETQYIYAVSSTTGGISFNYCDRCLKSGFEPYTALVGMGLFYADINESYRNQILLPSLRFHNKTVEEFDADVEARYLVEKQYFESLNKKEKEDSLDADDFDS